MRELFSKSQGWNENLQAIVINGTKTHNPDYILVHNLANSILRPAKWDADCERLTLIDRAICFFSRPNDKDESYINAIETLALQAYAPRKKRSRIFKAICDSLGVTDLSAGSEFQRLFAQFADELSTRKIDFKLFMSLNPAHFLTMSNPKRDKRGSTLTFCHSFNVTDCDYNCGCSGIGKPLANFLCTNLTTVSCFRVAFTILSPAVMALEDMRTGRTPTLTLKFPFATTMPTILRLLP